MPVTKLTCPECGAVLKPSKPVPDGKTIKCPRCSKAFVVGKDNADAAAAKPAGKKPAPPAKPAARPKGDDDDDGPAVFTFAAEPAAEPEKQKPHWDDEEEEDEEEEEEDQNKRLARFYGSDDSVKDPRGPAQEALVKPSNLLILTGFLLIVMEVGSLGIWLFPFVFGEHVGVIPEDVLTEVDQKTGQTRKIKKEPGKQMEWKDLTSEQKKKMDEAVDEETNRRLLGMIPAICGIIYGGMIVFCAFKMQNMESVRWSWVGALLAIPAGAFSIDGLRWLHALIDDFMDDDGGATGWFPIGLASLWCAYVGVFCMITFQRKEVKTGFTWLPD